MSKKSIDYSNTIIYKIYCKDECITDIYIGHTTNFIQRKSSHKTECNNEKNYLKIYKIIRENGGWNNWNMIEIAKYNCKDSTEARIKENEHYNQLKATLNSCPPYVDKNNYFCSMCNLYCSGPKQYERHIESVKHNNLKVSKEDNDSQKTQELCFNFYCNYCDYNSSKKCDFKKHLTTRKHTNASDILRNTSKKTDEYNFTCNCGKSYIHDSSYYRHKKICIIKNEDEDKEVPTDKELIMMLLKQNTELIKEQSNIKQIILEFVKQESNDK